MGQSTCCQLKNEPDGFRDFAENQSFKAHAYDVVQMQDEPYAPSKRLVLARSLVFSPHIHLRFSSFYAFQKHVGEGSFGSVFEAESSAAPYQKIGNDLEYSHNGDLRTRRVAVKRFVLPTVSGDGEKSPYDRTRAVREAAGKRKSFEQERRILAQLEHPHIVKVFECFQEPTALHIVMELCSGGELYAQVVQRSLERRHNGGFTEVIARELFKQMLLAITYLHAKRIVHRDVKTENFLLLGDVSTRDGRIVKLCDFGTAIQLTDQHPRAMERIGTLSYTAPEIYAKEGADVIADAWSLGVVLYVLLVGASPFRNSLEEPRDETVRRICSGHFDETRTGWRSLSAESQAMVCDLLSVSEAARLSSSRALQHPWVTQRGALASSAGLSRKAEDLSCFAPQVIMHITRFLKLHPLQQLGVLVCAKVLPDADLFAISADTGIPWYDLFFLLDADGDGRLCFKECAKGLHSLIKPSAELTEDQLYVMAQGLDLDHSGGVDWIEWVALALLSCNIEGLGLEPICTAFRLLDRPSGDGMLGAADLLAVINTDASGKCLSATEGRQRVIELLEHWVPEETKTSQPEGQLAEQLSVARPPSSLSLQDFRRLVLRTVHAKVDSRKNGGYPVNPSLWASRYFCSQPTCCGDVSSFPWYSQDCAVPTVSHSDEDTHSFVHVRQQSIIEPRSKGRLHKNALAKKIKAEDDLDLDGDMM
mmetsp:Transcript_65444/g.182116  ORF Transcript_65444/g.182116 Transcript_65444/m.182116 type:complete len:705 (-) Transcript_65444:103-2217(-)